MKLYHATFSKLLRKIKKVGYLGNSPYKLWSDSNNKYVYLATDPDEAYSYAETALDDLENGRLYDMLEDDDIVVLETDTKYLDKNKLFKDKNVIDGTTTYQYEGIINCQCLKIFDINKYNNEILRIAGVKLNEEMIHAEKSFYDGDDFAYVLKNPTKNELRGYGLTRTRFICFNDETWLFFDPMQWIHSHIWNKYKDKFGGSTNMGFYDLHANEFIFIESMNYDEGEEGYEEEFNYYESKSRKWLLEQPYIVNTFGTDFNVMIYGDWVDNPW